MRDSPNFSTTTMLSSREGSCLGVAVGNADAAACTMEDPNHLRTAMMSHAVIEQTEGVLMKLHKIKEDEAYTILTYAFQRTNTKAARCGSRAR